MDKTFSASSECRTGSDIARRILSSHSSWLRMVRALAFQRRGNSENSCPPFKWNGCSTATVARNSENVFSSLPVAHAEQDMVEEQRGRGPSIASSGPGRRREENPRGPIHCRTVPMGVFRVPFGNLDLFRICKLHIPQRLC